MFNWDSLNGVEVFDQEKAMFFFRHVQEKIKEAGEIYGFDVSASFGKMKFSGMNCSADLECCLVVTLADGYRLAMTKGAVSFLLHHGFFGVPKSALGMKILFRGRQMRLLGLIWNGKKTKFFSGECEENGKFYKIPVPFVKGLLPL